jgi:hypothetical protein
LVVPASYGYIDDLRMWFRKLFGLKGDGSVTVEDVPENVANEEVDFRDVTPKV